MFGKNMFTKAIALSIWVACLPGVVVGQSKEETLADIRQELTFLHSELQLLKRELSTTAGANAPSGTGTMLQRMDALEQEQRRITSVVEHLQYRIDQIVKDGTNRIGDLEFRLVELEGGDVSSLGETTTLGGADTGSSASSSASSAASTSSGVEMAASEQGDFDRAKTALETGNNAKAVEQFDQFLLSYPDGPLTGQAHYWRAEALAGQGDWRNAARGFLESFSGFPQGQKAPKSLYRLGVSLDKIGQTKDACTTLAEVEIRYPSAPAVQDAKSQMASLGC